MLDEVKLKMVLDRIFIVIDSINNFFKKFGTGCIIVVSLLLFLESIIRLVWRTSIITVDEVGGLGMYLFIVLNLGPLYKNNEHLSMDVLVKKFSEKIRYVLRNILHVLTFMFASLTTYLWWRFLFISTLQSGRALPMTRIIEWPFHLIGVVSWAMLAITAAECLAIDLNRNIHKVNGGGQKK